MTSDTLAAYIERFQKLRLDKSHSRWTELTKHAAPYKPFLLLAVMDLIAQGSITTNLIEITPDLGEIFSVYCSFVLSPGRRGSLNLPFSHLRSDGFWHLLPQPGQEALVEAQLQFKSIVKLKEAVLGAKLVDHLFELLCVQETRDALRQVLIETYFALEIQPKLIEQGIINHNAYQYSQQLLKRKKRKIKESSPDTGIEKPVRDQGFKRAIVKAYDHRCAFCGIRMQTPDGHTAVEAAHIIPWSESYDDSPQNGMALCRLCHWTFDEGLLGVSDEYELIGSPQLKATHNIPGHINTLVSRGIIGPQEEYLWPDTEALIWHREKVFSRY